MHAKERYRGETCADNWLCDRTFSMADTWCEYHGGKFVY